MFSTESIKKLVLDALIDDTEYRRAFVKVIGKEIKEELDKWQKKLIVLI